jgi:hypothetical protein
VKFFAEALSRVPQYMIQRNFALNLKTEVFQAVLRQVWCLPTASARRRSAWSHRGILGTPRVRLHFTLHGDC